MRAEVLEVHQQSFLSEWKADPCKIDSNDLDEGDGQSPPKRYQDDPEYRTLEEGDVDSGGKVEPKNRREAIAGVQAMEDGTVPQLYRPTPEQVAERGTMDFIDEAGNMWDIKSFTMDGALTDEMAAGQIQTWVNTCIKADYGIIVDLSYLPNARAQQLLDALRQHPGYDPAKFAITRGQF
ncbi:MAG: hypothetical protein AAFV53_19725 [Myxococcota bacterium]